MNKCMVACKLMALIGSMKDRCTILTERCEVGKQIQGPGTIGFPYNIKSARLACLVAYVIDIVCEQGLNLG